MQITSKHILKTNLPQKLAQLSNDTMSLQNSNLSTDFKQIANLQYQFPYLIDKIKFIIKSLKVERQKINYLEKMLKVNDLKVNNLNRVRINQNNIEQFIHMFIRTISKK
ncbi:Hypothetical_protein [Hexamita inflata]|uniref:Hypothetical_protein n=1 Tax=Hexamita inflata TaxID=28002 RepID=A0AA86R133_9EUKA|nr:Hypothetical protein HINF_LOCUS48295 [Hexamita inflata]